MKYDPNAYDTPPYAAVDDPAADHKTAAIAFDDRLTAEESLAVLANDPHVVGAAIYDQDGSLFADYRRASPLSGEYQTAGDAPSLPASPRPEGVRLASQRAEISRRIALNEEQLGFVYIERDLDDIAAGRRSYLGRHVGDGRVHPR